MSLVDNPEHPALNQEVDDEGHQRTSGLSAEQRIAKADSTQDDLNQLPNVILLVTQHNNHYAVNVTEVPSLLCSHTTNGHVDEDQTNDGAA